VLDVDHPLYQPMQVKAAELRDPRCTNDDPIVLRDLMLIPVAKP
jgi:hypothetical protein